MKVCFISPGATSIFFPDMPPTHGGAEAQLSLFGRELARRSGFDTISTKGRTYHPGRAALRFELRRRGEDGAAACQAALRKAVMKARLEDFSREEFSSARDEAVDQVCSMTLKWDAAGILTLAAAPAVSRLALDLLGEPARKEAAAASLLDNCEIGRAHV